MKYKHLKIFKKKLTFKNKELSMILQYSTNKSNLFSLMNKIFKNKLFTLSNKKSLSFKILKGTSIINFKRKGFYKAFQTSRFDLKKLVSERQLIGLSSFYW
jgi:hypothetical protein